MRRFIISIITIFFFNLTLLSQHTIDSSFIYKSVEETIDTVGKINVVQSAAIKSLLSKKTIINEAKPLQKGFRIQIMSVTGANSRDKANMEKAKFLMEFDDIRVYIVYQEPYFKVRLGDFRTKLNALKYQQEIFVDYPQAFIVSDKVNIPYVKKDQVDLINMPDSNL